MKLLILLLLLSVCESYGDVTRDTKKDIILVKLDIVVNEDTAHCIPRVGNGNTTKEIREVVVENGRKIRLEDGLQAVYGRLQKAKCKYDNGSGISYDLGLGYNIQNYKQTSNYAWFEEQEVTEAKLGTWSCKLQFNHDTKLNINPVDEKGYTYAYCNISVKHPDASHTTPSSSAHQNDSSKNNNTWYIIGGVILGIIVLLVIIGQTIALCYFRKKAQPQRRMDKMAPRNQDSNDRARYSSPPCKKNKDPVPACDRDSHIYEMVVVNANYNKASDLVALVNCEANVRQLRDRPPLPLPHEMTETPELLPRASKKPSSIASVSSSLSLLSNRSSILSKKKGKKLPPPPVLESKKAPPRPPKQVDEESLPGSLKRPAKATPLSLATGPATANKLGTMPKKTAGTESHMSELKNIFKNRNIGKDTPTSSPTATSKEPLKVQTKPNTKPTKSETQAKQPLTVPNKSGVPPNQVKLILPKIEAGLKTLKPVSASKTTNPMPPIKPPPLTKKPSTNLAQKWPPIQDTPLASNPEKQKTSPIQSRPLPKPDGPLLPDPIPEDDIPIYEMTADSEDEMRDTDDDEEWTYEQLEKYNIYNM